MFYYYKIFFIIIFGYIVIFSNSDHEIVKCKTESFLQSLTIHQKSDLLYLWMNYTKGYCQDNLNTTSILSIFLKNQPEEMNSIRSFMMLLPISSQIKFQQIWKNDTVPRKQKPFLIAKLAKQNQLNVFEKLQKQMIKKQMIFQRKLSQLTDEAAIAHGELMKLREEHHGIFKKLTPSIRKELDDLYS